MSERASFARVAVIVDGLPVRSSSAALHRPRPRRDRPRKDRFALMISAFAYAPPATETDAEASLATWEEEGGALEERAPEPRPFDLALLEMALATCRVLPPGGRLRFLADFLFPLRQEDT